MEFNRNFTMNQVIWLVVMLFGFGFAMLIGSALGSADFSMVTISLGFFFGVALLLCLQANYWMLLPLSLGASFPALPLSGRTLEFPEIAITVCSLYFLLRVATRKERFSLFRAINVPILLFAAWV